MRFIAGVILVATFYAGGLFGFGNDFCRPPLCPGKISITERGGVEPTIYTCRQSNDLINFVALCEAVVVVDEDLEEEQIDSFTLEGTLLTQSKSKKAGKFSDQFKLPWFVGGEIAYAVSCNTEVFLDGGYSRGNGKSDSYTCVFPEVAGVLDPPTPPDDLKPQERVHVREKYDDLKNWGAHLGARYYFPTFCNCANLFVGTKVGFRHRDSVKSKLTVTFNDSVNGEVIEEVGKITYYPNHNVISGGFQFGVNFQLCSCLSLVVMGEAIGTGAFKFGKDVEIARGTVNTVETENDDEGEITQAIREAGTILTIPVRRSGTIMTFPVHVGLKFTF